VGGGVTSGKSFMDHLPHFMSCSRCQGTSWSGFLLLWSLRSNNTYIIKQTKIKWYLIYIGSSGKKWRGAEMMPICQHSPFFTWADICQINYGVLSCWALLNPALPTASDNPSLSSWKPKPVILYLPHIPSFSSYFIPFYFYFDIGGKKLKILRSTRGNQQKGGDGLLWPVF